MIECLCAKCGNKWLLHNPNATCELCPYCGHTSIEKHQRDQTPAIVNAPQAAVQQPLEPKDCPACGRTMSPTATHCIYCGTDPTTGRLWGAGPAPTAMRLNPNSPSAATTKSTPSDPMPPGRPTLETRTQSSSIEQAPRSGGGATKAAIALLLIVGVVGAVWYFTQWHPNFTLAVEPRTSRPRGEQVEFTYKLKKDDLVRTSSHMDMKFKISMNGKTESVNASLDYKQYTRITEVLPSGGFLVRTTSKFISGDGPQGFDMSGMSRALANIMIEAELDKHGWIRPGSLVDMSDGDAGGASFDSGGMILRALPRLRMASGEVVDVHKVVPLPQKPIQGMAQFIGAGRPSLTGDCLFKGIEVRNGRQLAHLSIQALMIWEGDGKFNCQKVQFKGGVLIKGSCFYDIEAGIVSEVYLTVKMEAFANAPGQAEVSIVGTVDYYDFSDLNPTDE